MLEGIWHMDYPKDGLYADANNGGASMWDNYEVLPTRLKREDDLGLAMKLVKASLLQGVSNCKENCFVAYYLLAVWLRHPVLFLCEGKVFLHAVMAKKRKSN